MCNCGGRFRHWAAMVALSMLAWASLPAQGAPPPHWKESGYGYNAQRTPLHRILADFAQTNGVELKLEGAFQDPVSGRVQGATVLEFLDRLAMLHRFQWFVYNNTLYISPSSESVLERIELASDSIPEAKAALNGLSLFEPKFGWGELTEERVIVITGPRAYVDHVKSVIQSPQAKKTEHEAMVFRLKYAAVDDRQVMIRDQPSVTPGVATILRNMLGGRSKGRSDVAQRLREPRNAYEDGGGSTQTPEPMSFMNRTPLMGALGGSGPTAGIGAGGNGSLLSSSSRASQASQVEGDVRTNSIIIWDLPSKRDYYQRLIDALDVPQRLVEIEAMIIDISRDRLKDISADLIIGNGRHSASLSAGATLTGQGLSGTVVLRSLDRFFANLRLLEADGEAQVIAKPSVMTLENLVAVLDLSQTVYLKATGERVANITPVTAGTMLRVTPRVIEEEGGLRVHMTVDIEDGKISTRSAAETPEVQRSTISTQAILENRESLVIGGYNSDSTGANDQGVPGLKDVPLFGGLFSSTQASSQSRQRLFIITPRLVGGLPQTAAAAVAPEEWVQLTKVQTVESESAPSTDAVTVPPPTRNTKDLPDLLPSDLVRLQR